MYLNLNSLTISGLTDIFESGLRTKNQTLRASFFMSGICELLVFSFVFSSIKFKNQVIIVNDDRCVDISIVVKVELPISYSIE